MTTTTAVDNLVTLSVADAVITTTAVDNLVTTTLGVGDPVTATTADDHLVTTASTFNNLTAISGMRNIETTKTRSTAGVATPPEEARGGSTNEYISPRPFTLHTQNMNYRNNTKGNI